MSRSNTMRAPVRADARDWAASTISSSTSSVEEGPVRPNKARPIEARSFRISAWNTTMPAKAT